MFRHLLSAVLLAGLSVAAHGHEVWGNAAHTHGGEVLKAELGYGHYPELEPIAADRLSLFPKPLQLLTPQGKIDLVRRGQHNYQFETPRVVADGSYLLLAQYRPTFWSRNAAGWQRQNLTQMKDATYCEQTSMFGKAVVNLGHESASKELISRPVGDLLEIVPLENPANVRVGEVLPVRVLFRGEPLPDATVVATFDGFSHRDPADKSHRLEPQAFSDTTRADGTVGVIPLRQGSWKVRVVHKTDFADQAVCGQLAAYTTLTFEIGSSHH